MNGQYFIIDGDFTSFKVKLFIQNPFVMYHVFINKFLLQYEHHAKGNGSG